MLVLLPPAGLASYLCRLSTLCVHLSVPGGGFHPTTVLLLRGIWNVILADPEGVLYNCAATLYHVIHKAVYRNGCNNGHVACAVIDMLGSLSRK